MKTIAISNEILSLSSYGASELKQYINKYTVRGFNVSVIVIFFLLLFYIGFVKVTGMKSSTVNTAPINKIQLQNLKEQLSIDESVPKPPEQILISGPKSAAGTPLPVPETQITHEFANVDEISHASSKGGDGVDDGGWSKNINWNNEGKVDIKVREVEPDKDIFIPTEVDPYIDLTELQKMIVYPEMARRVGVEGKVVIRVLVGKDGKPKKADVDASDNELLDAAAKQAVMKSIFTPAIQNKIPIDCWVSIPIVFRLR